MHTVRLMILAKTLHVYAGSTVVVQMEDAGPWTHGVIIEGNGSDTWGQFYQVQVMKMDGAIMQKTKHIWYTPVTLEQCARAQLISQHVDTRQLNVPT